MELTRGRKNLKPVEGGSAVTIGAFDGIHRGHQAVISHLNAVASRRRLQTVLITFEPLPREYLDKFAAPPRLTTFREKFEALQPFTFNRIICLRFDDALRQMSARDFIEQIFVKGLNARYIALGDDFRFGQSREGDFNYVRDLAIDYGYEVEPTPTVDHAEERVSSTRIRKALATADFSLVTKLLGRTFTLSGRVIHGRKLGRQFGVPTANIALHRVNSPLSGVFVVSVDGPKFFGVPAVANVGVRPTVENNSKAYLEVHLLARNADLYGSRLRVHFLGKLREEKKFDSLEELKHAIQQDRVAAKAWHKANPACVNDKCLENYD